MKKLFEESVRVDFVTAEFYYFVKWKAKKLGIPFYSFHVNYVPFHALEMHYPLTFGTINTYIGPIKGSKLKNITQKEFVEAIIRFEEPTVSATEALENLYNEAIDELNRLP